MPTTIEEAERVLFLDTCAILDVLRFSKPSSGNNHLESARGLINLAERDVSPLAIAFADVVPDELRHNQATVAQSQRQFVDNIIKSALAVSRVGELLGLDGIASLPQDVSLGLVTKWHDQLMEALEGIVEQILAVGQVIPVSDQDKAAADLRVRSRRPPAVQGSSGTYDSQITETAMRVAAERPPRSTFLLSSNRKDFCDGASLHPILEQDFEEAGLVFVMTWGEARGALHELFAPDAEAGT